MGWTTKLIWCKRFLANQQYSFWDTSPLVGKAHHQETSFLGAWSFGIFPQISKATIYIWAIHYKSLAWMFRPFWIGFPYYSLPFGGDQPAGKVAINCLDIHSIGEARQDPKRTHQRNNPWVFTDRSPNVSGRTKDSHLLWPHRITWIVKTSCPKDPWTWRGWNLFFAGVFWGSQTRHWIEGSGY